jgi:hypothetical protein
VLYVGLAPFWSAMRRSGGDPRGDLREPGPQLVGRFDLLHERWLAPLAVETSTPSGGDPGTARSGVWDVLAHPNGRVYFTTFYESAGVVDAHSGQVWRFPALGPGLNELAAGPDGSVVATRYGGFGGDELASGSLVVFSPDGELLEEFALAGPPGFALAPKTVAFDPRRRRYWITTDLVRRASQAEEPPSLHPTLVLDEQGTEIERFDAPELHFMRFEEEDPQRGFAAHVSGRSLRLSAIGESGAALAGGGVLLDDDFEPALDFVQDLAFGPAGEVIVTRWSGRIHVLGRDGRLAVAHLPALEAGGLYYSAALANGRLCASHCADVSVVCVPGP